MTAHVSGLKTKLKEMGYQSEVTCCIHESSAMNVEDSVEENLFRDSKSLIDVEI